MGGLNKYDVQITEYALAQEKRIVYVTAVVYDKRDQLAQLNRMPKPKNPKKSKKLDNLGLLSLIQQPLICNIQITLLSIMITLL